MEYNHITYIYIYIWKINAVGQNEGDFTLNCSTFHLLLDIFSIKNGVYTSYFSSVPH